MSDSGGSRFTPQNKTTHERLSTNTVGLVALSDFRKRRAEVLEQQEREAREAAFSGTSTPDRSLSGTPDNAGSDSVNRRGSGPRLVKKSKKKSGKKLLSFGDEDDEAESDGSSLAVTPKPKDSDGTDGESDQNISKSKIKANAAVGLVPLGKTKTALRKEVAEREALRLEFLVLQEAVKATEVAIPFTFYDGANTPGGTVRVKKGDLAWVFLDKSRKVGAELGVGEKANATRAWARVGVDDLMLVRGTVIIPHHYDFYFFIMNKSLGPGGARLFDYSAEAPRLPPPSASDTDKSAGGLVTSASKAALAKALPDVNTLEGAQDDPMMTKVVDRRWYEKNKHIYPASMWQEFDPEKDYVTEVRRDTGGNTLFLK